MAVGLESGRECRRYLGCLGPTAQQRAGEAELATNVRVDGGMRADLGGLCRGLEARDLSSPSTGYMRIGDGTLDQVGSKVYVISSIACWHMHLWRAKSQAWMGGLIKQPTTD